MILAPSFALSEKNKAEKTIDKNKPKPYTKYLNLNTIYPYQHDKLK